jgi:hypothetical protein
MTLRRLGRVSQDPLDTTKRNLQPLPWAQTTQAALTRYREQQPSPADLARVAACQVTPLEYLQNPYLRDWALSNEVMWMFGNLMATLDQALDEETARKVAHAAGITHGKRWLSTFLAGQGLTGGVKAMAMWNDTGHTSAGPRQISGLFARYDEELVEVVHAVDSFEMHTGKESPASMAFFDGLVEGYQLADPKLSYVEELLRERADGGVEFVHRFWYLPE